jgi:RecB family exonuclease
VDKLTQSTRPDSVDAFHKPERLGPVSTWSYSALKTFEECPYRIYIQRVKKIPEPPSPAADRGTAIHKLAEDFVKGEIGELPIELTKFADDFHELRAMFADAKVELEGEWAFSVEWEPTAWMGPQTWARIKLDAMVHQDETSARVIDYKTGKKFGNEIPHAQQCLLYAIAAFFRYPNIELVQTELWYLDKGETTKRVFNRSEAMQFAPGFHRRGVIMTTTNDFAPTPSKDSCRWCPYGKGEHPECTWGVK